MTSQHWQEMTSHLTGNDGRMLYHVTGNEHKILYHVTGNEGKMLCHVTGNEHKILHPGPSQQGEEQSNLLYHKLPLQFKFVKNSELNIQHISSCTSHCLSKYTNKESKVFKFGCQGNSNTDCQGSSNIGRQGNSNTSCQGNIYTGCQGNSNTGCQGNSYTGLQNGQSLCLTQNSNSNFQVGCQGNSNVALQQVPLKSFSRYSRDHFQKTESCPKTKNQISNWNVPQFFIENRMTDCLQSHESVKLECVSANNIAWSKTNNSLSTNSLLRTGTRKDIKSVPIKKITTNNSKIWNTACNTPFTDSRLSSIRKDVPNVPVGQNTTCDNNRKTKVLSTHPGSHHKNKNLMYVPTNVAQNETIKPIQYISVPEQHGHVKSRVKCCSENMHVPVSEWAKDGSQFKYCSENIHHNNRQVDTMPGRKFVTINNGDAIDSAEHGGLQYDSKNTRLNKFHQHCVGASPYDLNSMSYRQKVKDNTNIQQGQGQGQIRPALYEHNTIPNIQIVSSVNRNKPKTSTLIEQHVIQNSEHDDQMPYTRIRRENVHGRVQLCDQNLTSKFQILNDSDGSILKIALTPSDTKQTASTPSATKQTASTPSATKQTASTPSVTKQTASTPSATKQTASTPSVTKQTASTPSVTKQTASTPSVTKQTCVQPNLFYGKSMPNIQIVKNSNGSHSKIAFTPVVTKQTHVQPNLCDRNPMPNIQIIQDNDRSNLKISSTPDFKKQTCVQPNLCDQNPMPNIQILKDSDGSILKIVSTPMVKKQTCVQPNLCDQNPMPNIQILKDSDGSILKIVSTPMVKKQTCVQPNLCDQNPMPNIQILKDSDGSILKIVSTPMVKNQTFVQPNLCNQNTIQNMQVVKGNDESHLKIASTPIITKQTHVQPNLCDRNTVPNIQIVKDNDGSNLKIVSTPVVAKQTCVQPNLCNENLVPNIQIVKDINGRHPKILTPVKKQTDDGNIFKIASTPSITKEVCIQPNLCDQNPKIVKENQPNTMSTPTFSGEDTMPYIKVKPGSREGQMVTVSTSTHTKQQGTDPHINFNSLSGGKQSVNYVSGQSVKLKQSVTLQNVENPFTQKKSVTLQNVENPVTQKKSVTLQNVKNPVTQKKSVTLQNVENPVTQKKSVTLQNLENPVTQKKSVTLQNVKNLVTQKKSVTLQNVENLVTQKKSVTLQNVKNPVTQKKSVTLQNVKNPVTQKKSVTLQNLESAVEQKQIVILPKVISVGDQQERVLLLDDGRRYVSLLCKKTPSYTVSENSILSESQQVVSKDGTEISISAESQQVVSRDGTENSISAESQQVVSKDGTEIKGDKHSKSLPKSALTKSSETTQQNIKHGRKILQFSPSQIKIGHGQRVVQSGAGLRQHTEHSSQNTQEIPELSVPGMSHHGSKVSKKTHTRPSQDQFRHSSLKIQTKPSEEYSQTVNDNCQKWEEHRGTVNDACQVWEENSKTVNVNGACQEWEEHSQTINDTYQKWKEHRETVNDTCQSQTINVTCQKWEEHSQTVNDTCQEWEEHSQTVNGNCREWEECRETVNDTCQKWEECRETVNDNCQKWEEHGETVTDTCQKWDKHSTVVRSDNFQKWEEPDGVVNGTFQWEDQSEINLDFADKNESLYKMTVNYESRDQGLKPKMVDSRFVLKSKEQEIEQEAGNSSDEVFVNEVNTKDCDINGNVVVDRIFLGKNAEQNFDHNLRKNLEKNKQPNIIVHNGKKSFDQQINKAYSTGSSFEQQDSPYLLEHDHPKHFPKSISLCKGQQGQSQSDYNIAWVLEHSRQSRENISEETDSDEDISETKSIEYVVLSDFEDPDDVEQSEQPSTEINQSHHQFNNTDQSDHYVNLTDQSKLNFTLINQTKHLNQKTQSGKHFNWIDQSEDFNQTDQSEDHLDQIDQSEYFNKIDKSEHFNNTGQSERHFNKIDQSEQEFNQIDKLQCVANTGDFSEDDKEIASDSDETTVPEEADILKCNDCFTLSSQTEALYIYQHTQTLEMSAKCYKCHKLFSNPLIMSCGEQFSNFPLPIQSQYLGDRLEKSTKEKKKARYVKRKMNLLLKQRRLYRLLEIRTLNKSYIPGEFVEVVNAGQCLYDDRDNRNPGRTDDCKLYQCDACNKEYREPGFLRRHMETHALTDYFQCDVCKMQFKGPRTLSLHSKIHQVSENIGTLETDDLLYQKSKQRLNLASVETENLQNQTSDQGVYMKTVETGNLKYQSSELGVNMRTVETGNLQYQNLEQGVNMRTMKKGSLKYQSSEQGVNMKTVETGNLQYQGFEQGVNMDVEINYRHRLLKTEVIKSSSNRDTNCQSAKSQRLTEYFPCDICNRELKSPAGLARHKTVHYKQPTEQSVCMIPDLKTPGNKRKAVKRTYKGRHGNLEETDYKKCRYDNVENGKGKQVSRRNTGNFQYGGNPKSRKHALALARNKVDDYNNLNLETCDLDNISDDRSTKYFICKICNKCCRTRVELGGHINTHLEYSQLTYNIGQQSGTPLKQSVVMSTQDLQRVYECEYCNKKCKHPGALGKHRTIHLPSIKKGKGFTSQKTGLKCIQADVKHEKCTTNFKHRMKEEQPKGMKFFVHEENWKREVTVVTDENSNVTCEENRKYSSRSRSSEELQYSNTDSSVSCSSHHSFLQERSKKRFSCEKCGDMFSYISDLRSHEACHLQLKQYACGVCNKNFNCPKYLLKHTKLHKEIISFKCTKCKCKFPQLKFLQKHVISCGNTEKRFKCEKCRRSFKRFGFLQKHVGSCLGEDNKYTCTNKKSDTGVSKKKYTCAKEKIHKCVNVKNPTCAKKNSSIQTAADKCFKKTNQTCVKEKTYSCLKCDASFTSVISLNTHISAEHVLKDRYLCGVCGKSFQLPCTISAHGITHGDKMVYQCGICKVKMDSFLQLKIHQKQHGQEKKNYACEFCDKRFTYTWNLDLHKRVHARNQNWKLIRQN